MQINAAGLFAHAAQSRRRNGRHVPVRALRETERTSAAFRRRQHVAELELGQERQARGA
jgi:hypothetical protein